RPAMSASSSRHSTLMMVESMSATSSVLRRRSVRTRLMSSLRPLARSRAMASTAWSATGMSKAKPGESSSTALAPSPANSFGSAPLPMTLRRNIVAAMKFDAVLIAGPTASGKSAAALALAEEIGGVVINADSMQVYREAPILTAQPPAEEQARTPHLLYGHVGVQEVYSVGRWREDAAKAMAQAGELGRVPIFVGGTGLYFMALTDGLADIPATPAEVREDARALLDDIGVEALHARLAERDPLTANRLRPSDPQRVLRSYEVFEATGRPLAEWQERPAAPLLDRSRIAAFILDMPREILRARIATRFEN